VAGWSEAQWPDGRWDVPERLAAHADEATADFRDWFGQLPYTVATLADHWRLDLEPPYQPGGKGSWVAPGSDADGRDVVLKVAWPHPESASEADGLRVWGGDGAVELYDALSAHGPLAQGSSDALLLERCTPGTPLNVVVGEDEQDVVVAGLLRRLRRAPTPAGFPSLQAMCASWATQFEAEYAAADAPLLPGDMVAEGMDLFRTLSASGDQVLLCTDCHAENIVAAGRGPWLVIDPKPHVGDPTYDLLQHVLNCRRRLLADPRRLVDRMADLLDVDRGRARSWLFARSVQESIASPWLAQVAHRMRPS